eukprot:scaffold33457_cov90-Isochrysis_galbana.AAC.6
MRRLGGEGLLNRRSRHRAQRDRLIGSQIPRGAAPDALSATTASSTKGASERGELKRNAPPPKRELSPSGPAGTPPRMASRRASAPNPPPPMGGAAAGRSSGKAACRISTARSAWLEATSATAAPAARRRLSASGSKLSSARGSASRGGSPSPPVRPSAAVSAAPAAAPARPAA